MDMLTYLHPEAVKKFLRCNNLEGVQISLPFLEKLGDAFQKIPYENLTKLIRSHSISDVEARIRLPELLYEEYVSFGTGGTCFSMTYFLQTILRSCGFETYPIMADRPLAPNTHCLSIITLKGRKYILDPGFMINRPLPLTDLPARYNLSHNNIIIGAKGTIPIPKHQMKYFTDLRQKEAGKRILPYEIAQRKEEARQYTIATFMQERIDIRYFMKDEPVPDEKFLEFWLDSFNWPTLRNISITTITDNGYVYARNNFLRTTTKESRRQERVKKRLELTLGKTFHINQHIIKDAFEVLEQIKKVKQSSIK